MAGRIRTIKPEILSDAKAARLSDRAWRLWISMWTLADDAGLAPADVDYLGAQVFWGAKDKSAHGARVELVNAGFISLYEINGEVYAKINGWKKHQKIDKPSPARFPVPPDDSEKAREDSRRLANVREDSTRDLEGTQTTTCTQTTTHDSHESLGGSQPPLALVAQTPSPPQFDFEGVYRAHWIRKEGKQDGMAICERDIRSEADFQQWTKAVKNYAAMMRAEGRDITRQKHFSSFMGCWRDYIDVVPPSVGPVDRESAEKGRSLF